MVHKPNLFFDTSALFTGIWSAQGGARLLLHLGEAEAVNLLVSPQVLQEIEGVVRRKAEEYLPYLVILLNQSRMAVVSTAPTDLWMRCQELVHQ
jgi:predicted nucleic acid-binding protein